VICWMLGWYLIGREVGTMSDLRVFSGCSVGAMLDVRLVLVWIEVGTMFDFLLVLFWMFVGC
jgi:hypothetical protein